MTAEQLQIIANMVVELTKLRQQECKHLSIENYAPELFVNLINAYLHREVRR